MYNVMIVDDEPLIVKGMRSIIDWGRYGLHIAAEAASGEEAMERFLESPVDVIITDIRMPGMNGLKLIETIRSIDPNVKFVVLSGYDDFNYVKEGIKFGIENYLLKPIDVNELIATGNTVSRKLDQEADRRSRTSLEKRILRDNILTRWVTRTIPLPELRQRAELMELPLGHRAYAVVTGNVLLTDPRADSSRPEVRSEMTLGVLEIMQGLAEQTAEYGMVPCFMDQEGDLVFLFSDSSGNLSREAIHEQLGHMQRRLREEWLIDVLFSMGPNVPSYTEVPDSYIKAKKQQVNSPLSREPFIVDGETGANRTAGADLGQKRLTLLSLLGKQDQAGLKQWLEEAFGELNRSPDAWLADAHSLALDIVLQVGKLAQRDRFMEAFTAIHRLRTIDEIQHYIRRFIEDALAMWSRQEEAVSPVIRKVVQEIKENYALELSLKTLGQKFRVHPVYLGQLFKKEMGAGFTDYVNRYRIQLAKDMLLHTERKANEIATLVGYADPNYFYKLFTKLSGLSPTDFRSTSRADTSALEEKVTDG